jgi:hypothetical protein
MFLFLGLNLAIFWHFHVYLWDNTHPKRGILVIFLSCLATFSSILFIKKTINILLYKNLTVEGALKTFKSFWLCGVLKAKIFKEKKKTNKFLISSVSEDILPKNALLLTNMRLTLDAWCKVEEMCWTHLYYYVHKCKYRTVEYTSYGQLRQRVQSLLLWPV